MRFRKTHAICIAALTAALFALAPYGVYAQETGDTTLPSGAVTEITAADDRVFPTGYLAIPNEKAPESVSVKGSGGRRLLRSAPVPKKWDNNNFAAYMPPLRNQYPFGSCWAQTAMALAEISLRKQTLIADPNLSETHLCYFSYNSVVDPYGGTEGDDNAMISRGAGDNYLNHGGNIVFAFPILASWMGAADDSGDLAYPASVAEMKTTIPNELAFEDRAHLKTCMFVNINGTSEDKQTVKQLVMDNGGVGISFYATNSTSAAVDDGIYNAEKNAFYDPVDHHSTNHAVTIVGWDDNFSKDNFNSNNRPEHNGAWLIRNSWTTGDFEHNQNYAGYFWMSYENRNIDDIACSLVFAKADDYDHNYQYDGAMATNAIVRDNGSIPIEAANVFTARSAQTLKAVSFSTDTSNVQYTIDIYNDLPAGDTLDLTGCESVKNVTGSTTCEGYYEVSLGDGVELDEGDRFAVVVSLRKPGSSVSIEHEDSGSSTWYRITASAEAGQSFLYNGYEWEDFGEERNKNFRIKAFTDERIDEIIDLDADTTTISVNDADYTGSEVTPLVTVTSRGRIVNASRYEVTYTNNINVGTGTAIITGVAGKSTGRAEMEFSINRVPLDRADVKILTGRGGQIVDNDQIVCPSVFPLSEISQHYLLYYKGIQLSEGTDYVLKEDPGSFLDCSDDESYFHFEGRGNFKDEKEMAAVIEETNISLGPEAAYRSDFDEGVYFCPGVTADIPDQYYANGDPVEPDEFTVTNETRGDLVKDVDYVITGYEDNINPTENAKVTIEGIGNYTGEWTFTFTILPKLFVSVEQTGTLTYNGSAQTAGYRIISNAPEGTVSVTFSDSPDGTYTGSVPAFTDAGSHRVYFKATATGFSNEVTGEFAVTIGKKPLGVSWSTQSSWIYDKSTHGVTASFSGACTGDTISPAAEGLTAVNAGEYTARVTGINGTKKNNYQLPSDGLTKDFSISRKRAVITSASATSEYTGSPLRNSTVTVNGFVDGEGVDVTVIGSQTAPGESDNVFTYTYRSGTLAGNYEIEENYGTLTVNWWDDSQARDHIHTVYAKSAVLDYNGLEQSVSGLTDESYSFVFKGERYTVSGLSASGSGTAVGIYPVEVSGTGRITRPDGENVTSHFAIETRNGKLEIRSRVLLSSDIELKGTLTYNGSEQTQDFTVTDGTRTLTKGTDYDVSGDKATAAGTHTLTITGKGGYSGTASKDYTIERGKLTGVSVSQSSSMTYTGSSHAPSLRTAADQSGVTFTYAKSTGSTFTSEIPGFTDAGEHTIYYRAEKEGYDAETGSVVVKVDKAKLGIQWSSEDTFTYDGKNHAPTAKPTGLLGSDSVTFSISGAASSAGTHTAQVTGMSGTGSSNYELPSDRSKQFTIVKKSSSSDSSSGSSAGSRSSTASGSASSGSKSPASAGSKTSTASGNKSSASTGSRSSTASGSAASGSRSSTASGSASSGSKSPASSGDADSGSKSKTGDAASADTKKTDVGDKDKKDKDAGDKDKKDSTPEKIEDGIRLADNEDALKTVLGEEKYNELVEGGEEPDIRLNVEPVKDVSPDDKRIAEECIQSHSEDIPNLKIGDYLDINLEVSEGGEWIRISEIDGKINLVLEVTKDLKEKGDEFWMLHIHGDESTLIKDSDDDPDTVTFGVDGFSTFVLLYSEKEPQETAPAVTPDPSGDKVAAAQEEPVSGPAAAVTTADTGASSDSDMWRVWVFAALIVAGALTGLVLAIRSKRKNGGNGKSA